MIKTYSCRGASFKIECLETFEQHPSWYSFEDESEVRERLWRIEPGDVVFDIGAAYGSYTLSALALGAAKVHAWSPQGIPGERSEAQTMHESLHENGWRSRCTIFRSGLYSQYGWVNASTQEFMLDPPHTFDPDVIHVDRLDSAGFDRLDRVTGSRVWMKIDVEGAEVEVLKGAEKFIHAQRPRILVENHLFKRATIEQEVRDWVLARGYVEESTTPYHSVSHSLYLPGGA